MSAEYNCPICGRRGEASPRYPRYVCIDCHRRATDAAGHDIWFTNQSVSGGYLAFYRDTNEPYDSHLCWIDGRKCWADEAHMGGTVVSIYDPQFNKE